jgi:pSer/pThr/pTyr-binding forkhead associated (FHA) protein
VQSEAGAAALERLRAEREAAAAKLREAQSAHAAATAREQSAAAQVDPEAEARQLLKADLARLKERYTEDHPDVRKLRSQLSELEARAPTAPVATPPGLPAGLQALQEQVSALDARISDAEAELGQTPHPVQRDDALGVELEAAKKRYLELLNQRMSAHLENPGDQFRKTTLTFRVLTPAVPPERPFWPDRRAFLLGGLALGLLSGLVLTIRAERWREEPASRPPRPRSRPDAARPVAASRRPNPAPPGSPSFDVNFGEAGAGAQHAAPASTVAPSDEPAAADFLDTAMIPAGPAVVPPSSSSGPALLEPGSIFWRTPRPRRASTEGDEASDPSEAEPAPSEWSDEEGSSALLEPGSVFVFLPARLSSDTQPVPIQATSIEPSPPLEPPLLPEEPAPAEVPPPSVVAAPALDFPPVAREPSVESPTVVLDPAAAAPETPAPASEPAPTIALPVPLPQQPQEAAAAGPALIVAGGPTDGSVLTLRPSASERLIGAAAYCHLRLNLPNVDPVHARVVCDAYGLSLADAGSTAGTYVNGRRIAGRYPLKDGDEVSLGPPGVVQSAGLRVRLPPVEKVTSSRELEPERPAREAPIVPARTLAEALIPPPRAPLPLPRTRVPAPATARSLEPSRPAPRGRPASRRGLAVGVALATVLAGGLAAWSGLLRSAPALAEVAPRRARPGQTLTLNGSGFELATDRNSVRLGSSLVRVVSATADRLEVELPRELGVRLPAVLPLVVEVAGRRSNPLTLDLAAAPRIARLRPGVARPGEAVTAVLEPGTVQAESVHVAGVAAQLTSNQPGEASFTVPAVAEASRVPVDVWVAGEPAERAYLAVGRLPLVTEVVPPRGPVGERVVLRGFGFDPDPVGNRVRFGQDQALVLSAAPEELVVSAPPAEPMPVGHAELPITVEALGATSSSPAQYTLLGPPSGTFLPRFFAAPVPELPGPNHAFVSNELSPVMLLTGPGAEASTAQRAARVAGVLNELVEAAAKPMALAFEVEPVPSVALAGGSFVVATATPADAIGYEGLWARLGRRGSATPRSVATFWTALLQDQLSLFVQHQRPTGVLELSVRGQVLADLHAQAVASTGGRKGVPTDLVNRLRTPLAPALREMALLLPQAGEANPGASVVGRWQGSMEEGDRGALPIQVRLFFEGRRLAGALTRRASGVSGEVRLREVVYERGSLAFSLPAGSGSLRFSGTVREESMAGLIVGDAGERKTVGFFTLRFAD